VYRRSIHDRWNSGCAFIFEKYPRIAGIRKAWDNVRSAQERKAFATHRDKCLQGVRHERFTTLRKYDDEEMLEFAQTEMEKRPCAVHSAVG